MLINFFLQRLACQIRSKPRNWGGNQWQAIMRIVFFFLSYPEHDKYARLLCGRYIVRINYDFSYARLGGRVVRFSFILCMED